MSNEPSALSKARSLFFFLLAVTDYLLSVFIHTENSASCGIRKKKLLNFASILLIVDKLYIAVQHQQATIKQ